MAEIVRPGENGFLVESADEAVNAVHVAKAVQRPGVRASVEERFDVERMVDDYVRLYRDVLDGRL